MDRRISTAVVVGLMLPLLAGCGGSSGDTAAPSATSVSPPSAPPPSATSSPSPTTTTADDRKLVAEASATFVDTALTLSYADGPDAAYRSRLRPLMTDHGYGEVSALIPSQKNLESVRAQFGKNARSKPQLVGEAAVTSLEGDRATATQKFTPRVQQRKDGKWRTVKAAVVEEDAKLTLRKEDGRWLVDSLG